MLVRLGRLGYAAKGTVYVVMGLLATEAALGIGGGTTDSRGALRTIGEAPFGKVALGIVMIGLFGYAAWRLTSAVTDAERRGDDASGIALRVADALRGVVYGSLAIWTLRFLTSRPTTWCGSPSMDDYLRSRFVVGNEIRHSLVSTDLYENQAADLESRVRSDVANGYSGPYAFIGHSNGGIVSRVSAQTLVNEGNYVRGVVTVSSLHGGVPLAKVGKTMFRVVMNVPALTNKVACDLFAHMACTLVQTVKGESASGISSILDEIINLNAPVLSEMTPHNPFYDHLNAGYEPFPKAAVIDQAWDKWTLFRVYGDGTCSVMYSSCDGRHVVAYVDKTYHRFLKCAVIGGIFSFVLPGARLVATACALSAAQLKGIDLVYKRVTVGTDHGDGVVPVHSQRYSNLDEAGQLYVYDSDSHVGVTRSTKQTGPRIADALNARLGVPIQ